MNRALTQDECRDQRTILKILERNKLSEWMGGTLFYRQVIRNLEAMQTTGTTDGEDLAELTDEDAKERPWVMVRDSEQSSWAGPYRYVAKDERSIDPKWLHEKYFVRRGNGSFEWFCQARRANQEELKQAGITE